MSLAISELTALHGGNQEAAFNAHQTVEALVFLMVFGRTLKATGQSVPQPTDCFDEPPYRRPSDLPF